MAASCFLFLGGVPAAAYELPKDASARKPGFEFPADMPARADGRWLMEKMGTISDGKTTFDIQKVWEICLDGKADRALHELEVREQQASVASLNEACDEPRPVYSQGVLSWAMHCQGPSHVDDKVGKTDIRHSTSFISGSETRAESVIVNRDNLIHSNGRFLTHMKRLGDCGGGLTPGGMLLMHWRVNGEETLKARQRRNVFEDVANSKVFTASSLGR
ncbi:MAG: hypothetical protein WBF88_13305 [Pusillimonas sp.]